ncbi:MAG: IS110 family transposase [Acidobacteriota bacterium]|nr:IS110 family transposase [Acidobacteriota bacterium]
MNMKKQNKHSIDSKGPQWGPMPARTVGVDIGDKHSWCCTLDEHGEVINLARVATSKKALGKKFETMEPCRIGLEVGTHSPWISRLLESFGHEVIVANAREMKAISQSSRKDDRVDAETLARLARADPRLLRPIRHRGEEAQADLMVIRGRAVLVGARTKVANAARGLAKAAGERLPHCAAEALGPEHLAELPTPLRTALEPLLKQVRSLTEQIRAYDKKIAEAAKSKYPETKLLKQVSGVGDLIALTFVLTIDDPKRFRRSRDAGCYVGLRPRRSNSGQDEPELPITKEGDGYLRVLLVQGAHYVLGWRGPDTDLRRWGLKLAERGRKNAKKRAVVAVARKLAVLLHQLWVSGEVYEPLRNSRAKAKPAAA